MGRVYLQPTTWSGLVYVVNSPAGSGAEPRQKTVLLLFNVLRSPLLTANSSPVQCLKFIAAPSTSAAPLQLQGPKPGTDYMVKIELPRDYQLVCQCTKSIKMSTF